MKKWHVTEQYTKVDHFTVEGETEQEALENFYTGKHKPEKSETLECLNAQIAQSNNPSLDPVGH